MYIIALISTFFLGVLLYIARNEEAAEDVVPFLKPFHKIALYLFKQLSLRFPKLFSSRQVEMDLTLLNPGSAKDWLKTEYYVKKIAVCLATIQVGALFGAAAKFSAEEKTILGENGVIDRGSYREGTREINIAAEYGRKRMDFQVQVAPRLLAEEEAEQLFDEFLEKLPDYILGENADLQNVVEDLKLEEQYEDYPITVEWESSRLDILSRQGHVREAEPQKEEQVLLTANLSYGIYTRTTEIEITLTPPVLTEEERLYREMKEMLLQSHDESLHKKEWRLPAQWQGESIYWRQIVEDYSLFLWAAAVASAVLIYLFSDRDLHERLEKRKKSLRQEYPEIVHKLVLFVGAGMTIRGAFGKIAGDYETKRRRGGKYSPVCEEMLYACREQQSGISEGMSYEHFGRRTGLQEYIRLSTLLTQNLKRGNHTLLERLREEADKAAQEQMQQSRKLGEEAGTKLLVPMVLMLAVVMAVIMIPAFSNM